MSETFEQTLPSGRTVILQHPDLADLIIDGQVPDYLTPLVEALIFRSMQSLGIATEAEQKQADDVLAVDEPRRRNELLRVVVCAASVDPRVTDSLEEAATLRAEGTNVQFISQLTTDDLIAVYYAAQGMLPALQTLFDQKKSQADPLESVHDSEQELSGTVESLGGSE